MKLRNIIATGTIILGGGLLGFRAGTALDFSHRLQSLPNEIKSTDVKRVIKIEGMPSRYFVYNQLEKEYDSLISLRGFNEARKEYEKIEQERKNGLYFLTIPGCMLIAYGLILRKESGA